MNISIDTVVKKYGSTEQLLKRFGFETEQTVKNWRRRGLPKGLIAEIHLDTGLSVKQLLKLSEPPE